MKVTSKWIDGMCFVGTTEAGHSVVMEGSAQEGQAKRGPSPMEMLLLGVAGCSSIDVVMIAEKQRQDIADCRATVTAKRADDTPRVFTEIHIHFEVLGPIVCTPLFTGFPERGQEKFSMMSTSSAPMRF